jgi:hypothetical protein
LRANLGLPHRGISEIQAQLTEGITFHCMNGSASMAVSKKEYEAANARMAAKREGPIAVAARYDRPRRRVVISLSHGMEFVFPADLAEGLASAAPADLAEIKIMPSGLGLHWPLLDADVYLPGLLAGVFGTK